MGGNQTLEHIGELSKLGLPTVFDDAVLKSRWSICSAELTALQVPESSDGVNPGDRRALWYLIAALRPQAVLEIGSCVGASTIHIAHAMREYSPEKKRLVSVDIIDVNVDPKAPWYRSGQPFSPAEMIERINAASFARFHKQDSQEFLTDCAEQFDVIFLDGNHSFERVVNELPLALAKLRTGGYVFLHDYFPNAEPLWPSGVVIDGPFRAVEHWRKKFANQLHVVPLGALPWPTKLGSTVTSLAIVGR